MGTYSSIPGEKEAEEIQEFCDILLCFVENGLSHIKAFIKYDSE